METDYTSPTPVKVIKSFTLSQESVDWLNDNIADRNRSKFVDMLIKRYAKRMTTAQIAQKETK